MIQYAYKLCIGMRSSDSQPFKFHYNKFLGTQQKEDTQAICRKSMYRLRAWT